VASLAVLLLACAAFAAGSPDKKKGDSSNPEVRASDQPPDYSDADKRKMAEIAERPDVKAEIQRRWDERRRRDLDYAYNLNLSLRYDVSGPQFAQFRENYGQLYRNPILQQYLNKIGEGLVPSDTPKTYAFRLLLDPVPLAEALSTGSIYISTGFVSLLDNEAQLAYVLAHEIAHVEKNHAYNQIRNEVLEDELYKEKEKDVQKKRALLALGAAAAGAAIGAGTGGGSGAALGATAGLLGGGLVAHFAIRNKMTVTEWSVVYENEADDAGFQYMLKTNYDAREVPKLYARLDNTVARDSRVGLGFVGSPGRVRERTSHVQDLLAGAYKAQISSKLQSPGLIGSTPEFSLIMAALKRDNGMIALDYDLFEMARDNLEEAVALRSNDALAQLYLGKVRLLTARTAADREQANGYFLKALQYDADRGELPEPHLEHALSLMAQDTSANSAEIRRELQAYVALYLRSNKGETPNNMHILYDYFTLAGDTSWYVPPVNIVSTKYVDSLSVNSAQSTGAPTAKQVLANATGGDYSSPPSPVEAKAPPVHPKPKPVVATPH
jgi:Zn-dependent protease with chaperone function